MNGRPPEQFTWSSRQWWLVICGFFLAQLAMIFAFSEYHSDSARPHRPRPNIHMVTTPVTSRQLAKSFFALDPTLFSSASLHSFSGPAWLRIPPLTYSLQDRDSPARWLAMDLAQLGTLSDSSVARLKPPLQPGILAGPKIEQVPLLRPNSSARTQSVARLTGDLLLRKTELPENLRCWPPPADLTLPLVGKSIVEMAADNDGEVVSARLRDPRSGLEAADAEALRVARLMHFTPMALPADAVPRMTWGNLIIEWQTALPDAAFTPNASTHVR